jgi:hypothetical protein
MAVLVIVDGPALVVEMTGLDRLWALRRRLEVPLAEVVGASVQAKDPLVDGVAFRVRGSSIPGLLTAGSYTVWKHARSREGERQFWLTKRGAEVLAIETRLRAPSLIVLELPDCGDVARRVNDAVTARTVQR